MYYAAPGFSNYIVKYFHKKENLKRKNQGKNISFNDIKKLYLKRVSHEGIYNLHNFVE